MEMSVVLPAPLGPSSPKNSPCSTARSIPASACTGPKRRAIPAISTAGAMVAGPERSVLTSGLEQVLDAVELGQRDEVRRDVDEGERRAFGGRTAPPGKKHGHA